jgi:hypothetical protein
MSCAFRAWANLAASRVERREQLQTWALSHLSQRSLSVREQ